jgi:hypothetical protein
MHMGQFWNIQPNTQHDFKPHMLVMSNLTFEFGSYLTIFSIINECSL